MAVAASLGMMQDLFAAPLALLAACVAAAAIYMTVRAARGGREPLEFLEKAAVPARRSGMLVVRPGWVRTAITLDIAYSAFVVASITRLFLHPVRTLAVPSLGRLLFGVIASIGTMGVLVFVHYMATRLVRPKRVLVPVGAN